MDPKTEMESKVDVPPEKAPGSLEAVDLEATAAGKSRWERSWPTIACGAGLFSDGYLNGVWALNCVPPPQLLSALILTWLVSRSLDPSIPFSRGSIPKNMPSLLPARMSLRSLSPVLWSVCLYLDTQVITGRENGLL